MGGNIYHNPDDSPVAGQFGYINVLALSPAVGRWVLLAIRLGIVALMAWAIGWRTLPRDDARRGLHYGLVAAAMLILNQRSWDHHAVVLLVAYGAVWYTLTYGRFGRRARIACLVGALLAAGLNWVMGKSLFVALAGKARGKELADLVEAWGPTFWHFALVFAVCVVLLRVMRSADAAGQRIYDPCRQSLRPRRPAR